MGNTISEHGALVTVRLSNPRPQPFLLGDGVRALPGTVEVAALVSTSAAMTSILPVLIGFPLGLPRVREIRRRTTGGGAEVTTTYAVDLEVGGVRFAALEVTDGACGREFLQVRGLAEADDGGELPAFHVILGRDVLHHARLVYEGREGTFQLAFC